MGEWVNMRLQILAMLVLTSGGWAGQAEPEFPINQSSLGDIADRIHQDWPDVQQIERKALDVILCTLIKSDQNLLKAKINAASDYKALMSNPERFRGEVVKINGHALNFRKITTPKMQSEVAELWYGQVIDLNGKVYSVISMKWAKNGENVVIAGVFLKRLAYVTRNNKLLRSPLVVMKDFETANEHLDLTSSILQKLPREEQINDFIMPDRIVMTMVEQKGDVKLEIEGKHYEIQSDNPASLSNYVKTWFAEYKIDTSLDELPFKVKLKIPQEMKMVVVAKLVNELARLKLTKIQYSFAEDIPTPSKSEKESKK
jgi:hypothetical protein